MKVEKTWFKRKNDVKKVLIMLVLLLLCLVFALFAVLILQNGRLFSSDTPCASSECIKSASAIINFIDTSIEPCDNFHHFACGSFLENHEKPVFSKLQETATEKLNDLITGHSTKQPLPEPLKQQQRFYTTCLNTTEIEDDNSETFLTWMEQLGGWAVLKGRFWNERHFDWVASMVKTRNLGFEYQHFLSVVLDNNGSQPPLLSIGRPAMGTVVPKEFHETYMELMTDIAVELGAPINQAKSEFIKVFQFEQQLNAIIGDAEVNDVNEILEIKELATRYPSVSWVPFLQNITRVPFLARNMSVLFKANQYLQNLLNLMSQTPKKTQCNYIIWKIIASNWNYFKKSIRDRYKRFMVQMKPLVWQTTRETFCLQQSKYYFPLVAEDFFARTHISMEVRQDVREMVDGIIRELMEVMEKGSRKQAKKLFKHIDFYIGGLKNGNADLVEEGKKEAVAILDGGILEITKTLYLRHQDNYYETISKNESEISEIQAKQLALTLNTEIFFNSTLDIFVVPASILKGFIFQFNRPQYMNYAGLGNLIGKELVQWCFRQTFNACLLNSDNADAEADSFGSKLAFEAYQKWVASHGEEKRLAGLNYTSNQIFWIVLEALRCNHQNHTLFEAASQFSNDFGCPINTTITPNN